MDTITTHAAGTARIEWAEKSRTYDVRIPGGVTLHVVEDGTTPTPVDMIHAPPTVWRSYVEPVCTATQTEMPAFTDTTRTDED